MLQARRSEAAPLFSTEFAQTEKKKTENLKPGCESYKKKVTQKKPMSSGRQCAGGTVKQRWLSPNHSSIFVEPSQEDSYTPSTLQLQPTESSSWDQCFRAEL